eukprot:9781189-Alexandrium_andersonii.AAC.1
MYGHTPSTLPNRQWGAEHSRTQRTSYTTPLGLRSRMRYPCEQAANSPDTVNSPDTANTRHNEQPDTMTHWTLRLRVQSASCGPQVRGSCSAPSPPATC